MLDPVEILDLQHCRRQDPMWAEKKAGHCLADAAACDARMLEFIDFAAGAIGPDVAAELVKTANSFGDMAARYRARAKILMGDD